jgi:hypothetical protein
MAAKPKPPQAAPASLERFDRNGSGDRRAGQDTAGTLDTAISQKGLLHPSVLIGRAGGASDGLTESGSHGYS